VGSGSNINNLSGLINEIKIPLPPIDIQEKIVSEIEVLEKKEERLKKEADGLRGEIESIVKSIQGKSKKLGEVLTLEYGQPLPEQSRILGEYPVMGSNGVVGYHNEYLIQSPSIIIGRKGSAGKVTWIDKNSFPIDTTFFVKLINLKDELKLLCYILKFVNLETISGGTGVPGLNRNNVYGLEIKLPPIKEQREIVLKIEKLEEKINELEKEISLIPSLKEEVLKRYL
jgi:restriction endonuclease S subunit